jgi:oligopeptide transport system substrate-binding protein
VERAGLPKSDSWTDPQYGEVVGAGPFRIVQWDHKNKIVLERNPNFSGEMAKLDQVVLLIIDPAVGAYAYYKTDDLDIAGVSAEVYTTAKADPVLSKEINRYETACTNALAMDNALPPFDNKLVRQAFTYALNRDLREDVIDAGIHVKHLSWLPKGVPGYDSELGKEFEFNPEKARKALADAGYPDGKNLSEVTFTYPDVPVGQTVADWYKDQFKQVLNVDLKLHPIDINEFVARLWDKNNPLTGLYETGWCADYLHPSDWLQLVFGTGQDNNVFGYSNPEFDRLSKAADSELDPARALTEYKAAHAILVADFPVIFFNSTTVTRLVKPWVKNLTPNPLDGGVIGGFFWEDIDIVK